MNEWLTRTANNQILGPFAQSEICHKIERGDLKLQDEVCSANGYWFYLHEAEEVKAQLGIQVPRLRNQGAYDEITQTQTEVELDQDRTDPDSLRRPISPPTLVPPLVEVPLKSVDFEGEENTLLQPFQVKPAASLENMAIPIQTPPSVPVSALAGAVEVQHRNPGFEFSRWVGWMLALAMVLGTAVVLYRVFGLLSP